jgi:diguanylate cyclase (GGDEF)-like protein
VDPLTRLFNRGYLLDRLREELVRSARSRQAFSLVLLDLDHFQKMNEEFGRSITDEVLRNLAALLKRCCRGSDAVCRYAGSEMAILLADTPLNGAKIFAENVRKAVEAEELIVNGTKIRATVSMGIAEYSTHGKGLEELLSKVEYALAEAKVAGENSCKEAAG